jgi:ABC-type amino acid transport substrate-binding protein
MGFAKARKVELKVVPATGWAGLVPALVEGKGDLVAGRFSATAQRRRFVDFTEEVFPTRTVVVTRRPHAGVRSLEELKLERLGTIAGTSMFEALLAAGIAPSKIDSTLPSGELSPALRSGKISAAAWWLEGAIQAQRKDPELVLGLVLGPPESLAYAVRKEDQSLLAALNQHLQVVRSSGTWNRLTVKYFGDAAPAILKRAREE